MGWFFGFKLHVIMNNKGELMALKITPGNEDDRAPLESMAKGLKGKILADKGYIANFTQFEHKKFAIVFIFARLFPLK